MDISKAEQRVLHLLAQGGHLRVEKDERNRVAIATCVTRDGWRAPGLDIALFRKLKRRRYIASSRSGPYRITRLGLKRVRSQPDNR
ncbi:YjhX family toxin [Stappia stellulata]|uniref:YjhX family toxin n=1 Tax=Stappia stellulata TaxID=71235 RepID=UPI00040DD21E|nr:YjhX family toxin [Stappia stellulata]